MRMNAEREASVVETREVIEWYGDRVEESVLVKT
jgi:hypothetical protein